MLIRKPILALSLAASIMAGLPSLAHAHGGERSWYRYEEYRHDDYDDDHDDRPRYRRSYYESREYERPRYQPRRHYRDERRYRCGGSGTTGLLLGGVAGALLGRSVDRYGDRAPGTIVGAGAGALLGREVDRNSGC
ncbi:glycine zipper 2TM domain-containing protein [Sphingobium sp. JS3065]|uniref:glycine zipper 2TM domain-containing protein n=1 Tax=Sphingobium sp. JS3065 TaxID=2970925 RepID=UPI002264316C|nr:glycine zipper 2TM domain-containing protein [Sphingobium sp. JS3065]UZW54889.1 glycine zipper 2TM domain-containing protein [Sphingobium sp. JS3065]